MRDLAADWKRWTPTERVSAILLTMIIIVSLLSFSYLKL
jgi:hypothetical protein